MMNKMYFLGCMGILAASAMLSSCSSDNEKCKIGRASCRERV